MKNYKDLIEWCFSKLGTHYLYGYKGEIVTKSLNKALAEQYPNVWTSKYLNVANSWVGSRACDCSGLISWFTGKLRGSWEYMETSNEKLPYKNGMDLTDYIGWAIWKPGHIGVVVGKNEVIEERGQAYGCVHTKASERDFTHIFKIIDIDYNKYDYDNIGWNRDERGWWYAYGHVKGEYYRNEIKEIKGKYYAFDNDGYLIYDINKLKITDNGNITIK